MTKVLLALALLLLAHTATEAATPNTVAADLTKARLAWDFSIGTGGAPESFNVKCGPSSGVHTTTTVVPATATSVPLNQVVAAPGTYFCVVTAINEFGESPISNEISFRAGTAPVAPTNLRVEVQ